MQKIAKQYLNKKIIVFSININQKQHKNGKWKKEIEFPHKWSDFTLNKSFFNKEYNGLAILTGKINNIIVIDIDNVEHWNVLLKENNQQEPKTVKAMSGSGGIHFYFKYDDEYESITSKDHCFGKDYDIDIKTNGGCVICPPTKYFNKNLNKEVMYVWEKSIFDDEMTEIPLWIKKLLQNKQNIKNKKEDNKNIILQPQYLEIEQDDEELNFMITDIEYLVSILSYCRNDNYNDWVATSNQKLGIS